MCNVMHRGAYMSRYISMRFFAIVHNLHLRISESDVALIFFLWICSVFKLLKRN